MNIELLLEAEKRGILPEDKVALLNEARKRGLIGETTQAGPSPTEPSLTDRLGRQLGLAARYGVEGVGNIASMVSEPVRQALNVIPGVDIQYSPPSTIPDIAGLPSPAGTTENIVGEASRFLAGGAPFIKGAQLASQAPGAVTRGVGALMSENPLAQALSAGSAGASSGAAKEAGAGPTGQLAASLAGSTVPWVMGRSLLPSAQNSNVQTLLKEGVKPTIGQAVGGRVGAVEEKLQSLPLLGDAITTAKNRGLEQFNRAAINRALKPIGQQIDDIGQEGIRKAGNMLSGAYDDAIDRISFVRTPKGMPETLTADLTAGLEPKYAKMLSKLISEKVAGSIKNGVIKGDKFKAVISDIGNESAKFGAYQNSAARDYGAMVDALKGRLLATASKSANKEAVQALKAADKGYANLVRVEQAANAAKNNEGVFTPAQLNQAVRQADKSVRKRSVSRGTALMQDLSSPGQAVLGSKVPTSGTAERLFYGAGTAGAAMVEPSVLAGLLGGAAGYTPVAQDALVKALLARPEYAATLGRQTAQNLPAVLAGQQ